MKGNCTVGIPEAFSREGFAAGAVEAAVRTEGLEGVHEFKEILQL